MVTPKNLIQNSKTDLGWNIQDADYISWSSMRNRLADCLKKRSETSKNLAIKHAQKRAHDYENSDEEMTSSMPAKLQDSSGILDGIWDMVKAHIPTDRKVREILGVLRDLNSPNLSFPANYIGLCSDSEFIPQNDYEDFAEDSDANVHNVAGVRQCQIPTKDHTFEQHKYELHGRVARQQETLNNIKIEYKCLFPNAGIIDSNDEGYCYIRYLKRPKITFGPQLVKAHQVIAVGHRAT
ncbi:hypothetical protein BGX38DRAFT_1147010 [Terfezia claveryi]|nr:hypothetical protein BGX38DRAFT_1147010 [Terfezia claveryi]